MFAIMVENGSDLRPSNPNRKFKRRVYFQANQVGDQNAEWVIFEELSSSLVTMSAAELIDLVGLQLGCALETAAAKQAYT